MKYRVRGIVVKNYGRKTLLLLHAPSSNVRMRETREPKSSVYLIRGRRKALERKMIRNIPTQNLNKDDGRRKYTDFYTDNKPKVLKSVLNAKLLDCGWPSV